MTYVLQDSVTVAFVDWRVISSVDEVNVELVNEHEQAGVFHKVNTPEVYQ